MITIKEKTIIYSFLATAIIAFFAFGFFHLTKFETTDEPLWKYGRVKQYWQAMANHDWEKTYINDKPGATVSIFSGIGLLFEPAPEKNILLEPAATKDGLFNRFDTRKTEALNLAMRLPILLLTVLSLPIFYWLVFRAFGSKKLALFTVLFIFANPILVGVSQIINPDSFLWIFGGLGAFSFMALSNTREKKFLFLTGIFTGLAMLSKYTAVTLFLFYALFLFFKIIFQKTESSSKNSAYRRSAGDFGRIFLIFTLSLGIFSVFLPAVFIKSKYLSKGLSQFMPIESLAVGILAIVSILAFLAWKKDYLEIIWRFLAGYKKFMLYFSILIFLGIIFAVVANVWSGQKIIPFDQLHDAAYANEPKKFDFRPFLPKEDSWPKTAKLFFMEFYPFVFSLTPLSLLLVLFFSVQALRGKISRNFMPVAASVFLFFVFYFSSTLLVRVVTNVRYSIVLYPLFALLSAIAMAEIAEKLKLESHKKLALLSGIIFLSGATALWSVRPFYFNYANFLLPKKFTIHHSWGHGSYEAAQHLNSLPDAENLVIWSNTATICPFFEGKCLKSRKIDLEKVRPDYFVISKRGELKTGKSFVFLNAKPNDRDEKYYLEKLHEDWEWKLEIDGRPENYVKIVKFEK